MMTANMAQAQPFMRALPSRKVACHRDILRSNRRKDHDSDDNEFGSVKVPDEMLEYVETML